MTDYRLSPERIQARQATRDEFAILDRAEAKLLQLRVPLLLETSRDRVFVSALDGTGNSIHKDALEQFTVVGRLYKSVSSLRNPAIKVGYVPGIFTQEPSVEKFLDGASGMTFHRRVEQAYYDFCVQAARWIHDDPVARIHLVGIGFSRGAEAVPALQRMIHERGIRNPKDVEVSYDSDGLLSNITYANLPPLVQPGQTAQVALLVDPVATGLRDEERRAPASNVSTLQMTGLNEGRDLFPSTRHVPEGLTEGGRVANLGVPGSHSDAAGVYQLDGIGRRVDNMYVDVLNTMFGQPLLQKRAEAIDPRLYAIHRSEQHLLGAFTTAHYNQYGERRTHTDLAPACKVATLDPCARDPVDFRLAESLQWRHVERGRAPGGTDEKMEAALVAVARMHAQPNTRLDTLAASIGVPAAPQDVRNLFNHLADAASRGDDRAMSMVVNAYLATPSGQVFKHGITFVQTLRAGSGAGDTFDTVRDGLDPERHVNHPPQLQPPPQHAPPSMRHP